MIVRTENKFINLDKCSSFLISPDFESLQIEFCFRQIETESYDCEDLLPDYYLDENDNINSLLDLGKIFEDALTQHFKEGADFCDFSNDGFYLIQSKEND
tara:strand:- start:93 stop:392 length:300 start_codon:yes stop_codon:yes gene_type:complete